MKKLIKFFKNIYVFLYYLTPKGRDEKYWSEAGSNLEAGLFEKGAKELEVKKQCITYAKTIHKRKRLSNFHLGTLVGKKSAKELSSVDVKINPKTLKFQDA